MQITAYWDPVLLAACAQETQEAERIENHRNGFGRLTHDERDDMLLMPPRLRPNLHHGFFYSIHRGAWLVILPISVVWHLYTEWTLPANILLMHACLSKRVLIARTSKHLMNGSKMRSISAWRVAIARIWQHAHTTCYQVIITCCVKVPSWLQDCASGGASGGGFVACAPSSGEASCGRGVGQARLK
jgi:hypothetical protein